MSTPEHLRRPEVRRDARRVAGSVSQVHLKRTSAFPGTQDIVLLGRARADHLADRWRTATAFESLRGRAFAHPTFADFAQLGDSAITVAVERLAVPEEVELWLDVLDEIADGPRSSHGETGELSALWTAWARERGFIT